MHGGHFDDVGLGVPFRSNLVRDSAGGQDQRGSARGLQGSPVQPDAVAALDSLGVDVHEVYEEAVRLRTPDREWDISMKSGLPVGYYLWAPKGPAYVCRGVRQDKDLLAIVGVYLEEVQKGEPSKLSQCDEVDP